MLKKVLITTGMVSALAMTGCATMHNPATERNLADLQNKDWVVTEILGTEYKADPAQTTNIPMLRFDNSALSGFDGCNRVMGGYTVRGTQIAFSELATTKMQCLNATDVPQRFSQALNQVTQYKVSKKKLELQNSDKKTVIELKVR